MTIGKRRAAHLDGNQRAASDRAVLGAPIVHSHFTTGAFDLSTEGYDTLVVSHHVGLPYVADDPRQAQRFWRRVRWHWALVGGKP
jgi:hypothetical protein